MSEETLKDSLTNFERALQILKKAANEPLVSDRDLAGMIKLFEITYEVSWKCLKRLLSLQGSETLNPRDTFQTAYQEKILQNEQEWLRILKDRNISVHVYDEKQAHDLVERIIKQHISALDACLQNVKSRAKNLSDA